MAKAKDYTPLAIWDGETLRPVDYLDKRYLDEIGSPCYVEFRKYDRKTLEQLRYVHWLENLGAQNCREGATWEKGEIDDAVKLKCGFTRGVLTKPDGTVELLLKSKANFTKAEMSTFIETLIRYICEVVSPGMDPELLKAEAKRKAAPYKQENSRHRREEEMA